MIPLSVAILCVDCHLIGRADAHGRCEFCNSSAVIWLAEILERKPTLQLVKKQSAGA